MPKPKQNIRTGDGAGAGMGFRGGAGKPGYPVPDNLKHEIEPVDEIIEDVLSSILVPLDLKSGKNSKEFVPTASPLDIVVKQLVGKFISEVEKKGDDLGFGFNEDGYPLQDKYEFQSMPIAIENKKGSTRKWYDEDGKEKGSTKMHHDYGYVEGATGADGEPVDVYVGPDEDAEYAFVVHQNKAPDFEKYDEDKVMLGFKSEEDAKKAYLKQYNDDRFYGGMSSMPIEKFREKLSSGGKITNEARRWREYDMLSKRNSNGDELVLFDPQKFLSPAGEDRSKNDVNESKIPVLEVGSTKRSISLPSTAGDREKDASTIFDLFKVKIEERGTKILQKKQIGEGSRAIVFDIGGEKVLKITNDRTDVEALAKIKGKNAKHLVKVFDVFEFGGWDMYGAVTEKLTPLPGTTDDPNTSTGEAGEFDEAIDKTRVFVIMLKFHSLPWKEIEKKIPEFVADSATKISQEELNKNIAALKKFNFPEIVDELHANEIDCQDIWSANIMKKGSEYVLVDLGFSKVANPPELDYLEDMDDIIEATAGSWGSKGDPFNAPIVTHPVKSIQNDREELGKKGDVFSRTLHRNAHRLSKKGIDISKYKTLGGGANGVAYDLGDGTVLKITVDDSEAKTSNAIKGKKLKHVADIYDVFKFKIEDQDNRQFYGIHQEKLKDLAPEEKRNVIMAVDVLHARYAIWPHEPPEKIISFLTDLIPVISGENEKRRVLKVLYSKEFKEMMEIMKELDANNIKWYDMHVGNLKKKGDHLAAIDLGISDSEGKEPAVLERVVENTLRRLFEARADQVGVIVGRYEPFHRGHAAVIRDLGKKLNKIIMLVKKGERYDFDKIKNMIKLSLPDLISKIEIYELDGDITQKLSNIALGKSTLVGDTGFTIFVPKSDFEEVKSQIDSVRDSGKDLFFDPTIVNVMELPKAQDDDDAGGVKADVVRQAIDDKDEKKLKQLVDPHLVSNDMDFKNVIDDLVNEMTNRVMSEAAKIDERDIEDVLDANAEPLAKKGIHVSALKKLGAGTDGVAYDAGGGKVLKVTTNEEEAGASMKMKGSPGSHVVRVFDVFKFKPETVPGGKLLFGVYSERLTKLDRKETEDYDEISSFWLDPDVKNAVIPFLRNGDYNGLLGAIRNVLMKYELEGNPITVNEAGEVTAVGKVGAKKTPFSSQSSTEPAKKLEKEPGKPVDRAAATASVDAKMRVLDAKYKKYKLPDMLRDLRKNGIKFSDFHSGNVMKRGGEYVINDLGRSEGGLASGIPILEKQVDDVVNEFFAFTGMGGSMIGPRAGSSAVSSFKNRVDPNSKELWQNQLDRLQIKGSGSLPE